MTGIDTGSLFWIMGSQIFSPGARSSGSLPVSLSSPEVSLSPQRTLCRPTLASSSARSQSYGIPARVVRAIEMATEKLAPATASVRSMYVPTGEMLKIGTGSSAEQQRAKLGPPSLPPPSHPPLSAPNPPVTIRCGCHRGGGESRPNWHSSDRTMPRHPAFGVRPLTTPAEPATYGYGRS